ncbi:MAG: hypothetical protein IKN27_08580 [Selenomonadaceae bacterium]|nr:hypothetical protein [Selenomonadaceae bacterium]
MIHYTDDNRGRIQFRERRKQIIDFSGIRVGNITPTDCDGFIEYHGKAYILLELKRRGVEVPRGQLIALRRAVDDWQQADKVATLIIADHDVDDPARDIDAANCPVREFYYKGERKLCDYTVKELVDRFISFVDRRQPNE